MIQILQSGRMDYSRATQPPQPSRLLHLMAAKTQLISHILRLDKVRWEQVGCHQRGRTTAPAHQTPTHPHRRVLSHSHRLAVPRHLLERLHTQHLHSTIVHEDRPPQHILRRLLHSTLRLRDTLLLAPDTHLPRLHSHQRHLGIVLNRLRLAQRPHVTLRQVHPSAPLLLDVGVLCSERRYFH